MKTVKSENANEPLGFTMLSMDGENISIPYPNWVEKRVSSELRDRALRQMLYVASMMEKDAALCFTRGERKRLKSGKPLPQYGWNDVKNIDYLVSLFLVLLEDRTKATVH